MKYNAIDIFSGCGGLSLGMKRAGFNVVASVEIDSDAVKTYKDNHPNTVVFQEDIQNFDLKKMKSLLAGKPLHLLAGCPPCQGFSSIRRKNKKRSIQDKRNKLLLEFLRCIEELKPITIMMENVPGLVNYYLFPYFIKRLDELNYNPLCGEIDIFAYGIPQHRKRLVVLGSKLGIMKIVPGNSKKRTVKDVFEKINSNLIADYAHGVVAKHTSRIANMISLIPKDGGSRKDLPEEYILECHKDKQNVGFNDIYGRLSWDKPSGTITGGCLNPSKGRFLHPTEDRCITAREAALLQSFPIDYIFPSTISKTSLALLIGNALPPKFSYIQCDNIRAHLDEKLD